MKIGFIYYTFYPVTGGASVHGFNLARELSNLGYDLYKVNGAPDPYTEKLSNPVSGIFWILAHCDVIYVRMDYFMYVRNVISLLALAVGKKLVVELNSPSDELYLFGYGKTYIRTADRIMSKILKRVDAVITVSEPLKRYCTEELNLKNVYVIENGGEIFLQSGFKVRDAVKKRFSEIRKNHSRVVVWSGSLNEMQDLEQIQRIAESENGKAAVVMIVKEEEEGSAVYPLSAENLFIFRNIERDDVKYIISHSDIGLALYNDYHWSRWGFYNSSLKIFEYLNNGLLTLTNKKGTKIQRSYPNFRHVKSTGQMIREIEDFSDTDFQLSSPRTWKDVADETSKIIQKVVKGC